MALLHALLHVFLLVLLPELLLVLPLVPLDCISNLLFSFSRGREGAKSAEVKARPLVSEVRPLNQDQNQGQDRRVSWSQDQVSQQTTQTRLNEKAAPQEEEEAVKNSWDQRPSPLKKTRGGRGQGPVGVATALPALRKAQSVQSLSTGSGSDIGANPSPTPPQRPTTLPSSPRKPTSLVPPPQRPSPVPPRSPLQAAPSPSYMSPTASFMAKVSRCSSLGDGLHLDPPEEPSVTSTSSNSAASSHVAVLPVVAPSPSCTPATPLPRGLQARVTGGTAVGALPDKPSLASFSPSGWSRSSAAQPQPQDESDVEPVASPPPLCSSSTPLPSPVSGENHLLLFDCGYVPTLS